MNINKLASPDLFPQMENQNSPRVPFTLCFPLLSAIVQCYKAWVTNYKIVSSTYIFTGVLFLYCSCKTAYIAMWPERNYTLMQTHIVL